MSKSFSSLFYSGKLLPVAPGQVIMITGKTGDDAEYFDFFLGTDNGSHNDFGDIQFHASVVFTGLNPRIIRSCYTKRIGWEGIEEIKENLLPNYSPNPIKRGGEFKIAIYVDNEFFLLSVDDRPYCTYPFRKPLNDIRRLNIFGDVEAIHQVNQFVVQNGISKQRRASFGSIPAVDIGTAMVFKGSVSGSPDGEFELELIDEATQRVLLQLLINFATEEITAKSPNTDAG